MEGFGTASSSSTSSEPLSAVDIGEIASGLLFCIAVGIPVGLAWLWWISPLTAQTGIIFFLISLVCVFACKTAIVRYFGTWTLGLSYLSYAGAFMGPSMFRDLFFGVDKVSILLSKLTGDNIVHLAVPLVGIALHLLIQRLLGWSRKRAAAKVSSPKNPRTGLQVAMPGTPESFATTLAVGDLDVLETVYGYQSTVGGTLYCVLSTPYSFKISPAEDLEKIRNSLAAGLPVLSDHVIAKCGDAARHLVVDTGKIVQATRFAIKGNELRIAFVMGAHGVENAPTTRSFFKAFTKAR